MGNIKSIGYKLKSNNGSNVASGYITLRNDTSVIDEIIAIFKDCGYNISIQRNDNVMSAYDIIMKAIRNRHNIIIHDREELKYIREFLDSSFEPSETELARCVLHSKHNTGLFVFYYAPVDSVKANVYVDANKQFYFGQYELKDMVKLKDYEVYGKPCEESICR